MHAVEAAIAGRRLTLIDLARAWPDAQRVRAPLKALDRLLGNQHLHAEREPIHVAMTRWLVRAAIPVGGRTLTVLDMVFPAGQQGSPKAEKRFLQRLATVLPENVCPILVTDAGFRGPWFRAVEAMGWHWLGRLRNRTQLKPAQAANDASEWVPCKAMYEQYMGKTRDFGLMDVARSDPFTARVVLHGKPPQGRKASAAEHVGSVDQAQADADDDRARQRLRARRYRADGRRVLGR